MSMVFGMHPEANCKTHLQPLSSEENAVVGEKCQPETVTGSMKPPEKEKAFIY